VNLSFIGVDGSEIMVWCQESKGVAATQQPERKILPGSPDIKLSSETIPVKSLEPKEEIEEQIIDLTPLENEELKEDHCTIFYGETDHSYESIFGRYIQGCKTITIEDPYMSLPLGITT